MEKQIEETISHELEAYRQRLSIALKAARICVFEVDLLRQKYTYFENAQSIFGVQGDKILQDIQYFQDLSPQEYQKQAMDYFTHPDDHHVVEKAFESIFAGEPVSYQARMKAGNTKFIWCKLDVTPVIENGIPVKMIGVITDIHEMKENTDRLKQRTYIDEFTGVYHKRRAEKMIQDGLKDSSRRQALALLDLDDFKQINDNNGHAYGDQVLKALADEMRHIFHKDDIIGRFGGDEFIILIRELKSNWWLEEKLKELISCAPEFVTKSVGVAIFPEHGRDYRTLFDRADYALYQAKKRKNTYQIYRGQS